MVDRSEVRRIAALANLSIPEAEEEQLAQQLSQILGYVEKLAALDVSQVAAESNEATSAPLREDVLVPSLSPEQALANAPARVLTTFSVPKILE